MTIYQTRKFIYTQWFFTDDKLRRPSYPFIDEDENDFNILVNTENFQSNLLRTNQDFF